MALADHCCSETGLPVERTNLRLPLTDNLTVRRGVDKLIVDAYSKQRARG